MTELDSYVPASSKLGHSHVTTIFRDTRLGIGAAGLRTLRPVPVLFRTDDNAADSGILAGLAVLTLPVVAYSFAQLWSLLAGGSLAHAIRAFLP